MMRQIFFLFGIFFILSSCSHQAEFGKNNPKASHDQWSVLLQKYVDEEGFVDYASFRQDSSKLIQYLSQLSNNPPGSNWSDEEQIAFWINAYNAFTVKLILDYYPLESIKDIKDGIAFVNSVWDIKFFSIGGKEMDLNNIEHGILRKKFDEPRIHFAINCASMSCPKLLNEAYIADQLDRQLTSVAEAFLANDKKNEISEDQVVISKIFSWFSKDFKKDGSLIDFLNKYAPVEISDEARISYMDYDWGLNEQ